MHKLEDMVNLVKGLKLFAVTELGISENPSFQSVEEGKEKGKWFYGIYTSRTDRIEPYFKDYGPYETYTDEKQWRDRIADLSKYDIDINPVVWEALGFKECQIKKSLLRASKSRLSYVVLHENVHIHCKMNSIDCGRQVEEALADCFAYEGARMYFSKTNPAIVRQITQLQTHYLEFYTSLNELYSKINEAYSRSKEEGRALLETAEDIFRPFRRKKNLKFKVNNATLLSHKNYSTHSRQVFEALKGIHPREYMSNRDLLYEKLAGLLPPKAE